MFSDDLREVILFFLFSTKSILLTYAVGWILYLPFGKIFQYKNAVFFFKLLLGFTFIPSMYAIYFTSFYTILSIVPVIYIAFLIASRKVWQLNCKIELLNLLFCLVTLLIFISIQLYRNDFFNSSVEWLSQADSGVYLNVATYLVKTGIETSSPWYQLIEVSADKLAKPYHYGDLWQLAFFLEGSSFTAIKVLTYNFIPFLGAIATMGGYALWTSFCAKDTIRVKILGITVAFVAVLFNTSISNVSWSDEFNHNLIMYFKIAPLNIFLLGSFLLLRAQQYTAGLVVAILIPIFNVIYAPIILSAFGIFFLFKLFVAAPTLKIMINFGILILASLYIILFYKLFGSLQTPSVSIEPKTGGYWYWLIKEFAAVSVKYCIFNCVLLLLGVLVFKYRSKLDTSAKNILLVSVLLLLCSVAAISLLNNNVEAFQLTRLLMSPINGIIFLIIVAFLVNIKLSPNHRIIFLLSVITLLMYSAIATIFLFTQQEDPVSKDFLAKADKMLANVNNPIGGFINNKELENTYNADPRTCYACNFLKGLDKDYYWANNINVPESLESLKYPERTQAIKLSPFYRFIQYLKNNGTYKSYQDAQIQFINEYKVAFVILEKGATIPIDIANRSKQILQDSLTGHRLLLLK
jgi:hypothetical protein